MLKTCDRCFRLLYTWSRILSFIIFYGTVRLKASQYRIMSAAVQTVNTSEKLLSYIAVNSKQHHLFFKTCVWQTTIFLRSRLNSYQPSDQIPRKPINILDGYIDNSSACIRTDLSSSLAMYNIQLIARYDEIFGRKNSAKGPNLDIKLSNITGNRSKYIATGRNFWLSVDTYTVPFCIGHYVQVFC